MKVVPKAEMKADQTAEMRVGQMAYHLAVM